MKKVIHIASALMAAVLAFISCERADVNRPDVQEGGRPIQFTVESEWPEITKGLITTVQDIESTGFNVWGARITSVDEGSTGRPVFGVSGAAVTYQSGNWVSAKERFWYKGYYNFCAVVSASGFSGTQSSGLEQTDDSGVTTLRYSNEMSLDLGDNGLNLAQTQDDIMYAFGNVDNSAGEASTVPLVFEHAFALLDIRIVLNGASVTEVRLHGIHDCIEGQLVFRQEKSVSTGGESQTVTSNLSDLLEGADLTTEINPYYLKQYGAADDLDYDTGNGTVSVLDGGLLVFPETLTETPLTVTAGLSYEGKTTEIERVINTGEWAPGSTNVYVIEVDTSIFGTI